MNSNSNGIFCAKNPSNLVAPLKINDKFLGKPGNNIIRSEEKDFKFTSTLKDDTNKYDYHSKITKSIKLNKYDTVGDYKYEDGYFTRSLIPKRFYVVHK